MFFSHGGRGPCVWGSGGDAHPHGVIDGSWREVPHHKSAPSPHTHTHTHMHARTHTQTHSHTHTHAHTHTHTQPAQPLTPPFVSLRLFFFIIFHRAQVGRTHTHARGLPHTGAYHGCFCIFENELLADYGSIRGRCQTPSLLTTVTRIDDLVDRLFLYL